MWIYLCKIGENKDKIIISRFESKLASGEVPSQPTISPSKEHHRKLDLSCHLADWESWTEGINCDNEFISHCCADGRNCWAPHSYEEEGGHTNLGMGFWLSTFPSLSSPRQLSTAQTRGPPFPAGLEASSPTIRFLAP